MVVNPGGVNNAPKRGLKVVGATHCDPEDPSDLLCAIACGAADAGRQQLYRRHLTGWLEYHLRCQQDYEPWVYGAEVEAELAAGLITYAAEPDGMPACASPPTAVTRLLAVRSGDDVVLSWQPVVASPAVDGYRVYRSPEFGFEAPLLVASPGGTSWTDAGAAGSAANLSWRVRAFNAAGEGP